MTIIIQLYIVICIALLAFDIVFLLVKNRKTQVLYPKNTKFEKEIRQEIRFYENNGAFSEGFLDELPRKLEKVSNLITLISVIRDDEKMKKIFSRYIFSLVDEYAKRSQSERAYYAYVVSLLDYEQASSLVTFTGKFMDFLDSNSIYTFSNAMNALYHFGQTNLVLQGLDKVDARGEFYHKKLLIDGLLNGNMNFQEFNPLVEQRFLTYGPYLQASLLDFFRMNHYDVKELCMELILDHSTEEEVYYTAMRYFGKYPCPESEQYFLAVLKDPETQWVPQMLAIQGLSHADDPETRNVIRSLITSRDWYVRVNAAEYLYSHNLSHQEIYQILSQRDQYADEILLYCCRDDDELSQFISDTISAFEEQDARENNLIGKEAIS